MSWFLPIEVLLFGTFWVYLVFLVPAAVVTALKRQWLFLGLGVVTCGLLWFIGAFGRGKEGSWWSGQFYAEDPEPDTRAFEELQKKRRLRSFVSVAFLILVVGLLAARPAPLLGVNGKALQNDMGSLFSFEEKCLKRDDGDWTCFRYDDAVSGDVPYVVSVDSLGCWEGRPARGENRGRFPYSEPEPSGCLTIFSYMSPLDLLDGDRSGNSD